MYNHKKPKTEEKDIYPVPKLFQPTEEEIHEASQRLLKETNLESFGQYKKDKPKLRIVKKK